MPLFHVRVVDADGREVGGGFVTAPHVSLAYDNAVQAVEDSARLRPRKHTYEVSECPDMSGREAHMGKMQPCVRSRVYRPDGLVIAKREDVDA